MSRTPVEVALQPGGSLLSKVGSIARHADELLGDGGHAADAQAIQSLLQDPEVIEWMSAMDALAMLPIKR